MFDVLRYSGSDLFILAAVAGVVSVILGILSDLVMTEHGFGPARNAMIIFASGVVGVKLRAMYWPPTPTLELVSALVAALAAATMALLLASAVKRVLT
jgi:hypothetical protein